MSKKTTRKIVTTAMVPLIIASGVAFGTSGALAFVGGEGGPIENQVTDFSVANKTLEGGVSFDWSVAEDILGFEVTVYDLSDGVIHQSYVNTTTDKTGSFSEELPAGDYRLELASGVAEDRVVYMNEFITVEEVTVAPNAPNTVSVTEIDNEVIVSWLPSTEAGSSPVEHYTITVEYNGATETFTVASGAPLTYARHTLNLGDLPAGANLTIKLTASNATKTSSPVSIGFVVPLEAPDAVQNLSATTSEDEVVTISWDPPADTGGVSPEDTFYIIAVSDDASTSYFYPDRGVTELALDTLTMMKDYTISVSADNGDQIGEATELSYTPGANFAFPDLVPASFFTYDNSGFVKLAYEFAPKSWQEIASVVTIRDSETNEELFSDTLNDEGVLYIPSAIAELFTVGHDYVFSVENSWNGTSQVSESTVLTLQGSGLAPVTENTVSITPGQTGARFVLPQFIGAVDEVAWEVLDADGNIVDSGESSSNVIEVTAALQVNTDYTVRFQYISNALAVAGDWSESISFSTTEAQALTAPTNLNFNRADRVFTWEAPADAGTGLTYSGTISVNGIIQDTFTGLTGLSRTFPTPIGENDTAVFSVQADSATDSSPVATLTVTLNDAPTSSAPVLSPEDFNALDLDGLRTFEGIAKDGVITIKGMSGEEGLWVAGVGYFTHGFQPIPTEGVMLSQPSELGWRLVSPSGDLVYTGANLNPGDYTILLYDENLAPVGKVLLSAPAAPGSPGGSGGNTTGGGAKPGATTLENTGVAAPLGLAAAGLALLGGGFGLLRRKQKES